jgi:choline dehydrogenase-like flavoprotein
MKRHDILIVGSGPVGIAAACRLAESGLRVMVVEAGSAIIDPPGSHFRNQARFRQDPDCYFAAIEPYFAPVAGDLPGAADSSLVGGQGVIWTNNCPRAAAFERWDAMTPQQWEQRYAAAEQVLRVVPDPTAASRTGRAVQGRLHDVLAAKRRTIQGLTLCGRVLPDGEIHFNGPWEVLEAAAPDARQRIALRFGLRATRLRHRAGRVTGVDLAGADGAIEHIEAPVVLVAGGAIGSARLLHRSGIRPDALGRGISFHAVLFGQLVLAADMCPAAGAPDVAPRLWVPPTEACPWHIQVLRDTCPLPPAETVDNPHRLLEFQAFLPMEFRDENAFVMKGKGEAFRFTFSERDRERMQAMEADVRRLAAYLGPWRRGCEPAWLPHGIGHLVGTCRMDREGWQGVADRLGKVHGFADLHLAGVGLIPAPVAVNPTLTAVALALSTCEAIAAAA